MIFFRDYHSFLKEKFGCRVYKICVDGPFSCPNRDGTKSFGGCIFCDAQGSSSRTHQIGSSIKEQIIENLKIRKTRYKAKKFIVYFQSFTNTYGSIEKLKKYYDEAVFAHPDIVGLTIATRADCVNEETIRLIASYKKHLPYVNIEFGMQTIHDKTLKLINRQETHEDLKKAIHLTKKYCLSQSVHVILGLPEETKQDILATADFISKEKIEGVKMHFLVAMKNTPLATMYEKKLWSPLSYETFISLSCDFIERLHTDCVIHRIGGNGHPLHVLAPTWMYEKKTHIRNHLKQSFLKRNTKQGALCKY